MNGLRSLPHRHPRYLEFYRQRRPLLDEIVTRRGHVGDINDAFRKPTALRLKERRDWLLVATGRMGDRHRVALAAGALLTYALKDHPSRVCKSARRTSRTVALGTTGWGLPLCLSQNN